MERSLNQERLSKIEAQLKADADWTVKFLVLEATVPVLKAFYIPMKLNCKSRGFIENFIKFLFELI